MKINLISIGKNMPDWVEIAFKEYSKRFPPEIRLQLLELPLIKRQKNSNMAKIRDSEARQLLAAIPKNNYIIALDKTGKQWDTPGLAIQLQLWQTLGQDLSLLIGGPDGLTDNCLQQANQSWSLSNLTFPHPLARVIVAEQLYRAWTILAHHPYHR